MIAIILTTTPCQSAIDFDGANDYILANNTSLNLSNELTVSAWLRPELIAGDNRQWIVLDAANTFMSYLQPPSRLFYRLDGGTWDTGYDCTLSTWVNLTFVYDGTTIYSYVDGALQNSSPSGAGVLGAAANLSIGADPFGVINDWYNGEMDDLKIYNRSLTAIEVEALYNSRSKRPSGTLANGLVAHYEMDDDAIGEVVSMAKDSSGSLNHGEFQGFSNLTTALDNNDVPSNINTGNSLQLDGVNDFVEIDHNANLTPTSAISFSSWFNTANINKQQRVLSKTESGAYQLSFNENSACPVNTLCSLIQINGTYYAASTPVAGLANDTWYHTVGSFNGSAVSLYLDNVLVSSTPTPVGSITYSSSTPFCIGAESTTASGGTCQISLSFQGKIDDVRVYDKALSSLEVSYLYNGSGMNPGTSNLQALWTFDDDSALKDSSGNDNHGIATGGSSLQYVEGVINR